MYLPKSISKLQIKYKTQLRAFLIYILVLKPQKEFLRIYVTEKICS